jgi:predicted nucleotidyltransferase
MSQFVWPDVSTGVRDQVDRLDASIAALFGDVLVGVYLHGSLALGCFNPQRSDVDLIAVIERPVTPEERRSLGSLVLRLSGPKERPRQPPYPLEISLFAEAQLRPWRYPTPFDFHYGESQRERFQAGHFESKRTHDYDVAAHITILHQAGIVLRGPVIEDVFPAVPEKDYVDSLRRDLAWSRRQRADIYGVLSGSRVWATVAAGGLQSKDSGAAWALERAPSQFRQLVARALAVYRGESEDDRFESNEVSAYLDYVEATVRAIAAR